MESLEAIQKRVNIYNRIYFGNDIEKPIVVKLSKHLYNTNSRTNAYSITIDDVHYIMLNIKMLHASAEALRSTLVHELIHAWQDEWEPDWDATFAEDAGHTAKFHEWCDYLNSKFKFTYPLDRYCSESKAKSISNNTSVYYIYTSQSYTDADDSEQSYFVGICVKYLSAADIAKAKRRGFNVRFIKNPIVVNTKTPDEMGIITTPTKILTQVTADTFVHSYITAAETRKFLVESEQLNFEDGIEL